MGGWVGEWVGAPSKLAWPSTAWQRVSQPSAHSGKPGSIWVHHACFCPGHQSWQRAPHLSAWKQQPQPRLLSCTFLTHSILPAPLPRCCVILQGTRVCSAVWVAPTSRPTSPRQWCRRTAYSAAAQQRQSHADTRAHAAAAAVCVCSRPGVGRRPWQVAMCTSSRASPARCGRSCRLAQQHANPAQTGASPHCSSWVPRRSTQVSMRLQVCVCGSTHLWQPALHVGSPDSCCWRCALRCV